MISKEWKKLALEDVQKNQKITRLIELGNHTLQMMGYTEHGLRHVAFVASTAADLLEQLNYTPDEIRLAAIAGWVHDVGNAINRKNHAHTGAAILLPLLSEMGMAFEEVSAIANAVGNHDEETGVVTSSICAALIIADKLDTHRTRVRPEHDKSDIHDRVNYAVDRNEMVIDPKRMAIRFELDMDDSSSLMEYFEIYLRRMHMCEEAARYLGCTFELVFNGAIVNNHVS